MRYQRPIRIFPARPAAGADVRLRQRRLRGHLLGWALLPALLTTLSAQPARADIWGYVDANGSGHFSSLQLDKRYALIFRGGTAETDQGKAVAASPLSAARSRGGLKSRTLQLTYFEVSPSYKAVRHLIREASVTHGIDYELLQAMIATESGFNPQAVSPKGAIGLMQLIPPTAARYGVKDDKYSLAEEKLTDPEINIRAGSRYLNYLIKLFPGQIELAIAAYNAGEGAVKRAGNKIPDYPETQNYVKTVMQLYQRLKPQSGQGSAPLSAVAGLEISPAGRVRVEMGGSIILPPSLSNEP
jgi:soluble lytic murein transglycosylase-like protein